MKPAQPLHRFLEAAEVDCNTILLTYLTYMSSSSWFFIVTLCTSPMR